jgi:hypothetical protein
MPQPRSTIVSAAFAKQNTTVRTTTAHSAGSPTSAR